MRRLGIEVDFMIGVNHKNPGKSLHGAEEPEGAEGNYDRAISLITRKPMSLAKVPGV